MKEQKFKGVRHIIHDESNENFILHSDFNRGLYLLKE